MKNLKSIFFSCCVVPLFISIVTISIFIFCQWYINYKNTNNPNYGYPKLHLNESIPPCPASKFLMPENSNGIYIGMPSTEFDKARFKARYSDHLENTYIPDFPAQFIESGKVKTSQQSECDFKYYHFSLTENRELNTFESINMIGEVDLETKCIKNLIASINEKSKTKPKRGLWMEGFFDFERIYEHFYKPDTFKRTVRNPAPCPTLIWEDVNFVSIIKIPLNDVFSYSEKMSIKDWGWGIYSRNAFDVGYGRLLNTYSIYPDKYWVTDKNEIDKYFDFPEVRKLTADSGAEGYYLPEK